MFNSIKASVLIFGFVLPFSLSAFGASDKKEFIVGVQNFVGYLPESDYSNEQYRGFARELLDMFAKEKGYTFVYKAFPLKRLYDSFVRGSIDLKYPDNAYWSTDVKQGKKVVYSEPVVEYIDGVMVHPSNKGKGIENLKMLGMVAGYTPFIYMKLVNEKKITLLENQDFLGLLKQVIIKRVDGGYSNIAVSSYYLRNDIGDPNALAFDPSLPYTKSTRHLSSILYPNVIEEFNSFLKQKRKEVGELKARHRVEDIVKDYPAYKPN
ncbi:MAG: transporter substrate-binding domain-containing protein [Oligoflexales bacterium]|nr:transporter substrate-binding domain-containing protein [Oligoflexales bacterium]